MSMNCDKLFKQLFNELSSLDENQTKVVMQKGQPVKVRFELNKGATVQQIQDAETKLGVSLPKSFRNFLLCWNEAGLYLRPYYVGYTILDTHSLVKHNLEKRHLFGKRWNNNYVLFCDCGDGNYVGFDTGQMNEEGECPVLDCFHEVRPDEWGVIAPNFDNWLNRLVESKGLAVFWLNG
jgi:hypothetical protein